MMLFRREAINTMILFFYYTLTKRSQRNVNAFADVEHNNDDAPSAMLTILAPSELSTLMSYGNNDQAEQFNTDKCAVSCLIICLSATALPIDRVRWRTTDIGSLALVNLIRPVT